MYVKFVEAADGDGDAPAAVSVALGRDEGYVKDHRLW
jgi:hypothetical protein